MRNTKNKIQAIKALNANLTELQTDSHALQTKTDATFWRRSPPRPMNQAVKAKIKAHESSTKSIRFDEAVELIPDTSP
jgi:hypothetical protein